MIALWLPLWSLIGPDEGFVFLIIVFAFFITISIVVKFRTRSNMSCIVNNRTFVAQEQMALTKNPYQFRLSPFRPNANEQLIEDEDQARDRGLDEKSDAKRDDQKSAYINEEILENDGDKQSESPKINETSTTNQPANDSKPDESEPADDFEKGIRVDVLCKEDYYLCYFWGVNIDQFHNFMRLNSLGFCDRLFDGTLFDHAFLEKSEPRLINGTDQIKSFKLICSDKVNSETLGQSPRTCYPLVVILARDLRKDEANRDKNEVVFMINVLHVKDKVCPLETNVITRLLKKRNGLTINLQTLYTPEFEDEPGVGNTAICVICQENLVSIALLPCRHTCTCLECFTKIDKCPLCRSYIRSYFMLKFEEETNNSNEEQNSPPHSAEQTNQSSDQTSDQAPTYRNSQQNKNFFKKVGSKFTNLFKSQTSHD